MNQTVLNGAGEATGRRERNKQRVKERLYTAAITLISEQGYEQTSIDEIAERADVARGTFFNYFQRKEDLITAWGEQRRMKLRLGLEASAAAQEEDGATVVLHRCMEVLANINEQDRDSTKAMLTAWVKAGRPLLEEPYATEIFAEAVSAGRDRGEIVAGIDPERVGNVLRDAYLGTLYRWTQHGNDQFDLHRELFEVLRIVLTGIANRSA